MYALVNDKYEGVIWGRTPKGGVKLATLHGTIHFHPIKTKSIKPLNNGFKYVLGSLTKNNKMIVKAFENNHDMLVWFIEQDGRRTKHYTIYGLLNTPVKGLDIMNNPLISDLYKEKGKKTKQLYVKRQGRKRFKERYNEDWGNVTHT